MFVAPAKAGVHFSTRSVRRPDGSRPSPSFRRDVDDGQGAATPPALRENNLDSGQQVWKARDRGPPAATGLAALLGYLPVALLVRFGAETPRLGEGENREERRYAALTDCPAMVRML
jgi:hypothetical protein